jgi:hypothetical protein
VGLAHGVTHRPRSHAVPSIQPPDRRGPVQQKTGHVS